MLLQLRAVDQRITIHSVQDTKVTNILSIQCVSTKNPLKIQSQLQSSIQAQPQAGDKILSFFPHVNAIIIPTTKGIRSRVPTRYKPNEKSIHTKISKHPSAHAPPQLSYDLNLQPNPDHPRKDKSLQTEGVEERIQLATRSIHASDGFFEP